MRRDDIIMRQINHFFVIINRPLILHRLHLHCVLFKNRSDFSQHSLCLLLCYECCVVSIFVEILAHVTMFQVKKRILLASWTLVDVNASRSPFLFNFLHKLENAFLLFDYWLIWWDFLDFDFWLVSRSFLKVNWGSLRKCSKKPLLLSNKVLILHV